MPRKAAATALHPRVSPSEALRATKERIMRMSKEELVDSLKEAGIITKTGQVAKPYRGVFVKKSGAAK